MDSFYLDCWVPSIKKYCKVLELKIYQLDILSKYLINNNNLQIEKTFNEIILENLKEKEIFQHLTKFDKWFILCFLRAICISDTLTYQTQTGNINISLSTILTDLSEIEICPVPSFKINNIEFNFLLNHNLFVDNILYDILYSVKIDDNITVLNENNKKQFVDGLSQEIIQRLIDFLQTQDAKIDKFILLNKANLPGFKTVPFKLLDNTLFFFLKSIFLPWSHNFYKKKFVLMNKIGFQYNELDKLTPTEGDIFINLYLAEEKQKKSGSTYNTQ